MPKLQIKFRFFETTLRDAILLAKPRRNFAHFSNAFSSRLKAHSVSSHLFLAKMAPFDLASLLLCCQVTSFA